MIRHAMEHANLTVFPNITLGLFLIWFVLTLFWIYRKQSKELYATLSQMPLEDSPHPEKKPLNTSKERTTSPTNDNMEKNS